MHLKESNNNPRATLLPNLLNNMLYSTLLARFLTTIRVVINIIICSSVLKTCFIQRTYDYKFINKINIAFSRDPYF